MAVTIRFEKLDRRKGNSPKSKERDGCVITTESGYLRSRFVTWWELKDVVENEIAFKQREETK